MVYAAVLLAIAAISVRGTEVTRNRGFVSGIKTRVRTRNDRDAFWNSPTKSALRRRDCVETQLKAGSGSMSVLLEPPVQDPKAEAAEKKDRDRRNEFFLNKGRLRDLVSEDLPYLFERPQRTEPFRDDVLLSLESASLNINTMLKGKSQLKTFYAYLRWARQIAVGRVYVKVRMTPELDPLGTRVVARCEARLHPRFSSPTSKPVVVAFNSVYHLDQRGYVSKQVITDLNDTPVKILPQFVQSLIDPVRAGAPGDGLLVPPVGYPGPRIDPLEVVEEGHKALPSKYSSSAVATALGGDISEVRDTLSETGSTRLAADIVAASRKGLREAKDWVAAATPVEQRERSKVLSLPLVWKTHRKNRERSTRVRASGDTYAGGTIRKKQDADETTRDAAAMVAPLSKLQQGAANLFDDVVDVLAGMSPKTCSTSLDCRREHAFDERVGYECCSYGIVNLCCFPPDDDDYGGGFGQPLIPELQMVPIPIRKENPADYGGGYGPPGGYGGRGGYGGY